MINKKSYHVTTSKKKARIDKIKPNIDDLDVFVERKIVESTLKGKWLNKKYYKYFSNLVNVSDKWQQEVLYYVRDLKKVSKNKIHLRGISFYVEVVIIFMYCYIF